MDILKFESSTQLILINFVFLNLHKNSYKTVTTLFMLQLVVGLLIFELYYFGSREFGRGPYQQH